MSHPHKPLKVPTTESIENTEQQPWSLCACWVRDPRNSVSECDCMTVRWEKVTLLCLCIASLHLLHFSLVHPLTPRSGVVKVSSGRGLGRLDLLRHLFGAVVGQAQAHDGQHHGDLVDGAVLGLRLHLAGDLPLQRETQTGQRSKVSGNNEPVRTCFLSIKMLKPDWPNL